ncbi:MAG: Eukaryotic-type low-affinity urea transporter [Cytophagales bacterium]|jgi:urea transporter|nr:urea transporter [Bacteroidota bacterium]MBS1980184.1 urea transporter [Bacteroidota bacterium]WHZ08699.1 MAG: Eukaryotic-type low-affinity urea transporter [Cytophagales bacterium]
MNKLLEKIPFVNHILKGIGQIMLQENPWTGLLFLIGIFIGSWQYGVAAIVATAAATATAQLLKYEAHEINAGLYGFSAALVGTGLAFLFNHTLLLWLLIIVGGVLAAIVQHFFIIKKIPAYTLPFIVITWGFVFLIHKYLPIPAADLLQTKPESTSYDKYFTITNGFGEVIFQENKFSGILFFLGVIISNPVAAGYGLAASLSGAVFSWMNGQPIEQIQMGLFGFNAVLTAIVFSAVKKNSWLWVLAGTAITVAIHNLLVSVSFFSQVGGVFTFPFVAGTWLTLLIQKIFIKN